MSDRIIIAIFHEHKTLGPVIYPYVATSVNDISMRLIEPLTSGCCDNYPDLVTDEVRQFVELAEKYSENSIFRLFCKNQKFRLRDFIDSITEELCTKSIRPYIEKYLSKSISIIQRAEIPVFIKDSFDQTVSKACRITVVKEQYVPVFSFSRNEDGIQYSLKIRHDGRELPLLNNKVLIVCQLPCCLMIDRQLYTIKDIDAAKLKPFYTKPFIHIPRKFERSYFSGFVADTVSRLEVDVAGFTVENSHPLPVPVLIICQTLDLRYAVSLKFDYDGGRIGLEKNQDVVVTTSFNGNEVRLNKVHRHKRQERAWLNLLYDEGFEKEQNGFLLFPKINEKEQPIDIHRVISWLNFNKLRFVEMGFIVDDSAVRQDYFTGTVDLTMETGEKPDWFDVNICVRFGKFTFPFSRLKKYIVQGIREMELPDQTKAIIPEEWFARFHDLIQIGTVNEYGSFELPKYHFKLLGEISGIRHYDISKLSSGSDITELPIKLKADLRPYQKAGFEWLFRLQQNGFGGILADDMGLGKTLQTITLIQKLREDEIKNFGSLSDGVNLFDIQQPTAKPILIVMPLSLLYNWEHELRRFAPTLRARNLTEEVGWRLSDLPLFTDIALISYGTMRNYVNILSRKEYRCIILDESQNIKNPESKTYQAVMMLKGDFRLSISGTPIENRLTDLWAQMNFINPGLLGSLSYFKKNYAYPIEKLNDESKQVRLQNLIQPFILRRTKEMVASDLPELTRQTIYCSMSDAQRSLYEKEKSKIRNWVMDAVSKKGVNRSSILILKALHTLRLLANHPSLSNPEYSEDSGKSNAIFEQLSAITERGRKVLIFSSYVKHLHMIEKYLRGNQVGYVKLTGSLKQNERVSAVKKFQEDSNIQVFLISLKAGGTGLNLTAADYVFIIDPWWNPAAELQALNRAHRIGQEKKVFVYRFITRQTIEEKIQSLQERKSALSELFHGSDNPLSKISTEDLSDLLS